MPIVNRDDQQYLRDGQYKDSSNLNARAELHRRFSVNPRGWMNWVWDQYDIPAGARVLEIGSGPGWMWYEHLDRVDKSWTISISDFSPGMVAEQRKHLANSGLNIDFQVIDMQDIPFADDTFDVVIANHMLYHVPDQAKGVAEVRRVLKPGGIFYAAANGKQHLREMDALIISVFPHERETIEAAYHRNSFQLDDGDQVLKTGFDQVDMIRYEDHLHVTDVDALMAYILSGQSGADNLSDAEITTLRAEVQRRMDADGAVNITKDSGMFICK